MKEIICPNCHQSFSIDEEVFQSIRAQLRDQDFKDELAKREKAFEQSKQDAVKLAVAAIRESAQHTIAEKDAKLAELTTQIKAAEDAKTAAINAMIAQKDSEISKLQSQISSTESEYKLKLQEEVAKKETEITSLKTQLETKANEQELAVKNAVAEKETEIASLKAQINTKETEQELAIKNAVAEKTDELNRKTIEIEQLKGQIDNKEKEAELAQNNLKANYEQQLKFKDEEIERYKDFKAKQSTKMIGESLEVYCKNEFDKMRPVGFQNATFEKDNKVSETGSKGDFIFRERADDVEFISIMFEMKNEADTTATKHKNEDFFKELDKDRREKKCEYAILVTLLEPENDLYNSGIVDVSYKYEKMYVVRPQFFIPIITLLRNAARNSLQYRKELIAVQNRDIDITNFENKLGEFQIDFLKNCEKAGDNFNKAVVEIDKTIKKLEKIKEYLLTSISQLNNGNKVLQGITVKRLVRGNPTMAAKFKELKKEQNTEEEQNAEG